jgi:hypothetical protein
MTYVHGAAAIGGAVYGMKQAGNVLDHPNISGKVLGEYSAIKSGPLDRDMALTFSGARYKEVVLSEDTLLYRAGIADSPFGQYFSFENKMVLFKLVLIRHFYLSGRMGLPPL